MAADLPGLPGQTYYLRDHVIPDLLVRRVSDPSQRCPGCRRTYRDHDKTDSGRYRYCLAGQKLIELIEPKDAENGR